MNYFKVSTSLFKRYPIKYDIKSKYYGFKDSGKIINNFKYIQSYSETLMKVQCVGKYNYIKNINSNKLIKSNKINDEYKLSPICCYNYNNYMILDINK